MNFLDAEVKGVKDQFLTLLLTSGESVTVPMPSRKVTLGERVKLGVRPERVALHPDEALRGEIEVLEHLGSRAYVHARLGDGTRIVAETEGDTEARSGDRVTFRLRAEACHLFDGSGKTMRRSATKATRENHA